MEYITATREQIIANLKDSDISRKIDTMALDREYKYVLLSAATEAAGNSRKEAPTMIHCKVFCTNRAGTYGYQFMAAIWIKVGGDWYQASGSLTRGCGYDKISTAVDSAVRTIGLGSDLVGYFNGTGEHETVMDELAEVLADGKPWFKV